MSLFSFLLRRKTNLVCSMLVFSGWLTSSEQSSCCNACNSVQIAACRFAASFSFIDFLPLSLTSLRDRDKALMSSLIGGFRFQWLYCGESMPDLSISKVGLFLDSTAASIALFVNLFLDGKMRFSVSPGSTRAYSL